MKRARRAWIGGTAALLAACVAIAWATRDCHDEPTPRARPPRPGTTLARNLGDVRALAADDSGVYLGLPRAVARYDKRSQRVTEVTRSLPYDLVDLCLDGDRVVIAAGVHLLAAPKAGGPAVALVEGLQATHALACAGDRVYAAGHRGLFALGAFGEPEQLERAGAGSVAVDALAVYWTTADAVYRRAHTASDTVPIAVDQARPNGVALDATHVYWTNEGSYSAHLDAYHQDGAVVRMPLAGGDIEVLAREQLEPSAIVVFGERVAWLNCSCRALDPEGSSLVAAPTTGGAPTLLRAPAVHAQLAAHAAALFFTTEDGDLVEL